MSVVTIVVGVVTPAAATERLLPALTSEAPVLASEQSVLFVRRELQVVGEDCPDPPVLIDAGVPDAGVADDAGVPDAGVPDAGTPPPSRCEPVLRNTVTMIVQPRFVVPQEGATFAVLFVTPRPPEVQLGPAGLFTELAEITGPEIVIDEIFVEDPSLGYNCAPADEYNGGCGSVRNTDTETGDDVSWEPPDLDDAGIDDTSMPEIVAVGEYEVVRLDAMDTTALAGWLDALGYRYQQLDLDALAPYLGAGYTVTAVRVANADAIVTGLPPIALTWIGDTVRVPLGLGRQPGALSHVLSVYIAGPGRYQLAEGYVGFAGVTAMDAMEGTTFLTRTDLAVDPNRGEALDPVAFRVPGDPEYRQVVVIPQNVRVPSTDCPPQGTTPPDEEEGSCGGCGESEDEGCWCASGRGGGPTPEFILLIAVTGWAAVRRRRRR